MKGHVVRLNESKYYGFIRGDKNGDFFFHRDDFVGHWNDLVQDFHSSGKNEKIKVDFTERKTDKGWRALNVTREDYPNQAEKELE